MNIDSNDFRVPSGKKVDLQQVADDREALLQRQETISEAA